MHDEHTAWDHLVFWFLRDISLLKKLWTFPLFKSSNENDKAQGFQPNSILNLARPHFVKIHPHQWMLISTSSSSGQFMLCASQRLYNHSGRLCWSNHSHGSFHYLVYCVFCWVVQEGQSGQGLCVETTKPACGYLATTWQSKGMWLQLYGGGVGSFISMCSLQLFGKISNLLTAIISYCRFIMMQLSPLSLPREQFSVTPRR